MGFYINEFKTQGNIAVDDTILIKGTPATAGSKMLESFTPLFTAEAVERLEKAGYTVSGKTKVGEFGLDLVGESSYFGAEMADGQLVGAAAELVKKGKVKAALSVDLNGAPRRAAAISGVTFVKPTYGTVSRYGVISGAASGEQIGVTAKTAEVAAEVLSVIAGHDEKDGTSLPHESYSFDLDRPVKGMKIGVVKELYEAADKTSVDSYIESLKKAGAEVGFVSLDIVNAVKTAWTILMSAEVTNNLSRFDGVKYGHRTEDYKNIDELYVNSRTEAFGFLTKATILYGSYVLSKGKYEDCYDKSLRIRRLAVEAVKSLFPKYDALLAPVMSEKNIKPYNEDEAFERVYGESLFTAMASITGIPSVVTRGVALMGDYFAESTLLSIAKALEKEEK